MIFEKYTPESGNIVAKKLLTEMVDNEHVDEPYMHMLKRRITGEVTTECNDIYYIAYEDDKCYSRLWNGWGKHENAVGNFGHFMTLEEARGKGLGKKILELWFEDLSKNPNPPLALFCTAEIRAAKMYFPYGFRPALEGTECGPLYMPIGNSPETFQEFCDMYYEPSSILFVRKATVEWRHEIDCLLRFALMDMGIKFGIEGKGSLEKALIIHPETVNLIFTDKNRCVGWMIDGIAQVHPRYQGLELQEE